MSTAIINWNKFQLVLNNSFFPQELYFPVCKIPSPADLRDLQPVECRYTRWVPISTAHNCAESIDAVTTTVIKKEFYT